MSFESIFDDDAAEDIYGPALAADSKAAQWAANPFNPNADCSKIPDPSSGLRKGFQGGQDAINKSPIGKVIPGFVKEGANKLAPWNYKDFWRNCPVDTK